jgi:dihydroorotate dehydrogenase
VSAGTGGGVVWRRLVRPTLFALPPEAAHRAAFGGLRAALRLRPLRAAVARALVPRDPALRTEVFGRTLPSPVALAAGFDKDAVGVDALAALGFGAIEVGTITPRPQPGNPRPRLFRLPDDEALVNRMGFNGAGMQAAARRLRARTSDVVVGANVGRNKATPDERAVDDFAQATRELAPLVDYVTVNVSSPNTPGLRDLQAVERLRPLLVAVREAAAGTPVLVKIAPDLADEDVDAVADLARELSLAGIVATNTTIARPGLVTPAERVAAIGPGGLSGPPLRERALQVLRRLRARAGDELLLVASGGIAGADDAWERIRAGATLVQLYTGFVYGGPGTPSRVARGLAERARAAGYERVQDAVGTAVDRS